MNIGMLLMIFAIAIGAVIGIAYISANQSDTGTVFVDSYNGTQDAVANLSQNSTAQLTVAGSKIGGAGVMFIAGLIGVVVLLGFYAIVKGSGKTGNGRGG